MRILSCVLLIAMMFVAGCSKPSADQIDAGIKLGVPVAINAIFTRVAKKSPDAAKAAATALSANIDQDITPWLNGAALPPSAEIIPILESKLCKSLDSSYETGIVAALAILDANVSVNTPKLSDVDKKHVLTFVGAVKAGCDAFLKNKKVSMYDEPSGTAPVEYAKKEQLRYIPVPDIEIEGALAEVVVLQNKPVVTFERTEEYQLDCQPTWTKPAVAARMRAERHTIVRVERKICKGDETNKGTVIASPKDVKPSYTWDNIKTTKVDPNFTGMIVYTCPAWCDPCKTMEPIIAGLISEGCAIHRIDGDANPDLLVTQDIVKVPTFVLYKNGTEVDRHSGKQTREVVLSWLAE